MAVILIVDDRAINREFLRVLLDHAGHQTHMARDGKEALDLARRVDPDLVITDVLMPTMDGIEFTRRLNADAQLSGTPVIFYTATYRTTEARSLAESCGVKTIIAKPSEPQVVLDAVHRELGVAGSVLSLENMPAVTGQHRILGIDRLCSTTVLELSALQTKIRSAIEDNETPSARARQLQQISTTLDSSLAHAQALSMRLAALIEVGLDLAAQSDPRAMLEMFCHAGRDIMNAKTASACVMSEDGAVVEFVAWGIPAQQVNEIRAALEPSADMLGEVLASGLPRHVHVGGEPAAAGLPAVYPPCEALLIVPIATSVRTYGWFCLTDKIDGDSFSDDDEQLAQTLVAQLAPEYENLLLYDRLKRHAGLLRVEIDERKQAHEELRRSEDRFRQLAETIREIFFLYDVRTRSVLYVSPAYEQIWGRSCKSLYENAESWSEPIHDEDRAEVLASFEAALCTGELRLKYRINVGGRTRWIKATSYPIADDTGTVVRFAGTAEDVTESEVQAHKIRRLSRIHAVLSGINSAIVRIRERSSLLDEACRITVEHGGFALAWICLVQHDTGRIEFIAYRGDDSGGDVVARALMDTSISRRGLAAEAMSARRHVVHNDLAAASSNRLFDIALEHGYRAAVALPLLPDRKSSGSIVLLAREQGVFDADEMKLLDELAGDVSFALEYISREEQLHYLAYYDSLTDLPNTRLFEEHVEKALEGNDGKMTALFFVDLDRFTHLNDTLGRHVGDELLIMVGRRLKSTLAPHSSLARISSDTFAIVVPGVRAPTEVGLILQERVFAALGKPFAVDGSELRISARVGIAVHPTDGDDADTLFKNAEAALKEAKTSRARYLFYSADLNARVAQDLELEQRMLGALARQEFVVYYQPKVDTKTGKLVGLEALLRWNSPTEGLVAPGRFIPVLEASELILDVGRWVLERTLSDHSAWQRKGYDPPPVAVNVSPLQLRYPDFAQMVLAELAKQGVSGGALELEITESVIMADIESSIELLERIAASGIRIAVDDFGTGYSSLRYLGKLPVNELKIDRSFIMAMTDDSDSMTLVSTIIGLAHSFGLRVVAEGVESEEQAKFLTLMKCDLMQGYLFGRPQPAGEVEKLLVSHPADPSGSRQQPQLF